MSEMSSRWSRLARRLSLKPYGDELLTPGADFWIFSARLIVLTMALAEAIAWGYMGALMSRSSPLAVAAVASLFIFTLIWIVDATFMTLDLSRAFYERALLGKKESPAREKFRLAGGVAARVAIVSASLFITAPFLAQAIFASDVSDEMTRRNAAAVSAKRAEIERPFLARLETLRGEQKGLEEERVREAAGVGLSGRHGRGPALETIELQLAEKREEIAAAGRARGEALARFDALSRPELEQKHGVKFLQAGVHSSGQLLRDLLETPEFTGAELAVRAFLVFLFLGLIILKLFQPRSVAVYYNEQLHSVWGEYRKGLFDAYLPEQERPGAGGGMEPLRFEDWCIRTYAMIRSEDARRRETAAESRIHDLRVEQWQRLAGAAREELDPLVRQRDAVVVAIEELEGELHGARTGAASARAELETLDASAASMRDRIDHGGMDGATFERAVAALADLDARRRAATEALRASERAGELAAARLEARRSESATLDAEIAAKRTVIAEAEKGIGEERVRFVQGVGRERTPQPG